MSLYKGGQHTTAEITELFEVARSTSYRMVQRTAPLRAEPVAAKRGSEELVLEGGTRLVGI